MRNSMTIVLDESYIVDLGDGFTDSFGNPISSIGSSDYIDKVCESVFETGVMDELQSGWRDRVRIEVDEVVAADFVENCANLYANGDKDLESIARIIYPLIMPALREYKDEHAQTIKKEAPSEIRRECSDSLIPLYEATDGFFSINEIISMILDGFISSIDPLSSRFVHSKEILSELDDRILENREDINLDNEYFYQGPEHLGILEHSELNGIVSCVCIRTKSNLIPVCPADEDIINTHTMSIVKEVISREDD